jgi:hypothetical protein
VTFLVASSWSPDISQSPYVVTDGQVRILSRNTFALAMGVIGSLLSYARDVVITSLVIYIPLEGSATRARGRGGVGGSPTRTWWVRCDVR